MAVFAWQGIDAKGKPSKGIRDAESAKALRAALRKEGVLATSIEEEAKARKRVSREVDLSRLFQRVSTLDVALVTRQLATLLRAGVPLVEALTAIIDQLEKPLLKTAFTQTRDKVNEGSSLADALKAHPKVFPGVYVNMVAAGEASGMLDGVLERLADFLDSQADLRTKVTGALIYPMVLAVFAAFVVTIIMVFVVPKVTAIFADFEKALPWYTQLLITVSDFITGFWWLLLGLVVGAGWGLRRYRATPAGREKWDRTMLRLPLVGKLVVMVAVARFSRTLATLLSSGVPVLTALDITRNVLGNSILMRAVEEARESIREGESIATPLKRSGQFPPIVTHMIAVGERSGELERMLEHVAVAYDGQVSVRIAAMTRVLEPAMIIIMAAVVGSIAFSMMMPLLKINEFIGG
jgi:general secretion pathway protein F